VADYVRSMPGAELVDKGVSEDGGNLSVGQRQLLCMVRALLRKAPLLILDECSSACDDKTDGMIQTAVKEAFSDSTVLCIAHRLHTIMHYDAIIVMKDGCVAEHGSPFALLSDPTSQFAYMCQRSGDFDVLRHLAEETHRMR
jgi:ABC-type multidrug transport system fused ATPase/permease subunit